VKTTTQISLHISILWILFIWIEIPLIGQSIFDTSIVHRLELEVLQPGWRDSLIHFKENGINKRIKANISIDGKKWNDVGIRYKGHSSYFNFAKEELSKLPFNVDANFISKDQSFEDGIKKIKLSNNYRDLSYVREVLAGQIVGTYLPVPKMAFAEVFVNDVYLGLYTMIESIDGPFLERSFEQRGGVLFKCDPDWHAINEIGCAISDKSSLEYLGENVECYQKWYELKSKNGWDDLITLTRVLEKEPDQIETVLDVYSTLWMHALNNTLVNLDSYSGALCHNYYLFKSKNGVFTPLMWDLNLSFGGFQSPGHVPKIAHEDLNHVSPYLHIKDPHPSRPLINQLMSQSLYRKIYVFMIRTIIADYFENDVYLNRANQLHSLIADAVQSEDNRAYSFEAFQMSITTTVANGTQQLIGISELMTARTEYLLQHPTLQKDFPEVVSDIIDLQSDDYHIDLITKDVSEAWIYYRNSPLSSFNKMKMENRAADSWYVSLPKAVIKEYFFVMENVRAAGIYPNHAPKVCLKIFGQ
jgi:hypothetical protein